MESQFGFRNIRPKTREERKGVKDKVALEKHRLSQRVGHQARMHQANAPETTAGLTSCPTDAAGYISNAERFHTDTAGEAYQQRQEDIIRKKKAEEFRRIQTFKRDEDRYVSAEHKAQLEEERWHKMREQGINAKKNTSNVAYDVVTMRYNQDIHGEQQRYFDDLVRYRSKMRTKEVLDTNSRVPYNIINGNDKDKFVYPDPVLKPQSILDGVHSARADSRRTT